MVKSTKQNSPQAVVAIALITAACLIGDSMLYIALPTHWETAGLDSLWEVGILLSINRFVRLPLTPAIAWAYARIGVRTGVLAAVALTGLLTLGYGMVNHFAGWLALRCLWGVAWTLLRMGAYLMILDCTDEACSGAVFGRYNGLFRLGSLVGMLTGGIIADLWGITAAAFLFGGIALATLPLVLRYVPGVCVTPKETEPLSQRLRQINTPAIGRALFSGMLIAAAYQGVVASSLSHLIRSNWGQTVALGFGAVGAASLSGALQALRWSWEPWLAPWFGRFSDGRTSRSKTLGMLLIVAAGLVGAVALQLPIWLWLAAVIGMQVTATALTTIGDAAAVDAAQHRARATVMTLYVMATDIGAALGPFLGYLMAELWGTATMYQAAGCWLAALGLWWLVAERRVASQ